MIRALPLVALCGCQLVLGLDAVHGTAADAPMRTIHCDYALHEIHEDGAMPVPVAYDLPGTDFAQISVDGDAVPIAADGTFSFEARADRPYHLAVTTVDDTTPVEYERDSDTCHLVSAFSHRRGGQYPAVQTVVDLKPNPAPTAGIVRIASTGVRSLSSPAGTNLADASLDWMNALTPAQARAPLLDKDAGDRLYWVHYTLDAAKNYAVSDAFETATDLTQGSTTTITAAPVQPPARCAHLIAPRAAEGARLSQLTGNTSVLATWEIASVPAVRDGALDMLSLALPSTVAPVDDSADLTYRSPYRGEVDVGFLAVGAFFQLAHGGAIPKLLVDVSEMWQPVPTDSACPTVTLAAATVAAPTSFALANTPLTDVDQPVAIDRTQPVPFTFALTSEPVDDVLVELHEVVAINGATTLIAVQTYAPLHEQVAIDPALLRRGHTYVVHVVARRGWTAGRTGFDYRTYSYPAGDVARYSTTFVITS